MSGFIATGRKIGRIYPVAQDSAPAGTLECDGSAISRADYGALFDVIGTDYGSGDGSTTFNLPDLRGEFIRGWDNGRGVDSGRGHATTQSDELKSHTHGISCYDNPSGGARATSGSSGNSYTVNTQSTGGSETRPRNVAMMYVIEY